MNREKKYYIVIFLIAILLTGTLFLENSLGSRVVSIVTIITAITGAFSIFIQYKRDKDISQASFILEYSKYFYTLKETENTLFLLDRYRSGEKDVVNKIEYIGIVNYLYWCEELSTLYQKNVFDLETIDNLFSYNFFLVTNNKYVQEKELVPQSEFYKGVYFLHKEWTEYKKRTNQPIINEEESLALVKDYKLLVDKGNLDNKKVH